MANAPPNWPLSAPGFYLGYVDNGRVLLTLMGAQCTAKSFSTYCEAMQTGIDAMQAGDGVVSIHAIAAPAFWTDATLAERARRMKQIADLGERNKAKLKAAFKFEIQIPTHSLARVALRVLTTLVAMPYPFAIKTSMHETLAYLEQGKIGTREDVERWRAQIMPIVDLYAPDFADKPELSAAG